MNRQVFPWGYSCESVLGSWGVRSTARDVLKFLKANILLNEYSTNAGLMDALELSKMKFILLHVCMYVYVSNGLIKPSVFVSAQVPQRATDEDEYQIGTLCSNNICMYVCIFLYVRIF